MRGIDLVSRCVTAMNKGIDTAYLIVLNGSIEDGSAYPFGPEGPKGLPTDTSVTTEDGNQATICLFSATDLLAYVGAHSEEFEVEVLRDEEWNIIGFRDVLGEGINE